MEILAITNSDSKETCVLESLDIAASLTKSDSYEIVLQGTIIDSISGNGKLLIYVLSYVENVHDISSKEYDFELKDIILENLEGYSLISVPYNYEGKYFQFAIRLDVENQKSGVSEFNAKVYVGSSRVSSSLTNEDVWERLVSINHLRLWLFYPRRLQLVSSEPNAQTNDAIVSKRFDKLFSEDINLRSYESIEWEENKISLSNPFIGVARFEKRDSKTKQDQFERLEKQHQINIEKLSSQLKEIERQLSKDLALLRLEIARTAFFNRLLITLLILIIILLAVFMWFGKSS